MANVKRVLAHYNINLIIPNQSANIDWNQRKQVRVNVVRRKWHLPEAVVFRGQKFSDEASGFIVRMPLELNVYHSRVDLIKQIERGD